MPDYRIEILDAVPEVGRRRPISFDCQAANLEQAKAAGRAVARQIAPGRILAIRVWDVVAACTSADGPALHQTAELPYTIRQAIGL